MGDGEIRSEDIEARLSALFIVKTFDVTTSQASPLNGEKLIHVAKFVKLP